MKKTIVSLTICSTLFWLFGGVSLIIKILIGLDFLLPADVMPVIEVGIALAGGFLLTRIFRLLALYLQKRMLRALPAMLNASPFLTESVSPTGGRMTFQEDSCVVDPAKIPTAANDVH